MDVILHPDSTKVISYLSIQTILYSNLQLADSIVKVLDNSKSICRYFFLQIILHYTGQLCNIENVVFREL